MQKECEKGAKKIALGAPAGGRQDNQRLRPSLCNRLDQLPPKWARWPICYHGAILDLVYLVQVQVLLLVIGVPGTGISLSGTDTGNEVLVFLILVLVY